MKKCYIGIDISDFSIEIVKLKDSESVSLSRVLLPKGVVTKGIVIDEDSLGKSIKEVFEKGKIINMNDKCKEYIIVTIPKQQVYVKTFIEKSDTEKSNTFQEISKQLSSIVPINISELDIAYRKQVSGSQAFVLTAGISKEVIEGYKNTFEKAGIVPKKITIEVESLLQSLGNVKESMLVIDIGDLTTHIHAFDIGGVVNFSIISPFGVSRIQQTVSSKLSVSKSDAQKLIEDIGLDYEKKNDEVLYIMFNVFAGLIEDVKKSQQLFQEKGTKQLTSIVLIGGGSHIPKIDEYLSYHLKQTVMLGENKLPKEITQQDADGFLYTGAYGSALLAKTDSECVDFLSQKEEIEMEIKGKSKIKVKPSQETLFSIGAVVLTIAVGMLLFLYL